MMGGLQVVASGRKWLQVLQVVASGCKRCQWSQVVASVASGSKGGLQVVAQCGYPVIGKVSFLA